MPSHDSIILFAWKAVHWIKAKEMKIGTVIFIKKIVKERASLFF